MGRKRTLAAADSTGDRVEQLTKLSAILASAIDACDDAKELAQLLRQYREATRELAAASAAADLAEAVWGDRAEVDWPRWDEVEAEASRIAHYQAGKLLDGDREGFVAQLASSAAGRVLLRANTSVPTAVAKRGKKARYARMLRGPESCGWCFVMAARGFDFTSAEAASHTHRGCRCVVVPGEKDGSIGGCDLDGIEGRYRQIADACGPEASIDAIVRFAELHDPGWLYDGRTVEPDYADNPRQAYGRLVVPGDYSPENVVNRGDEWRGLFAHDTLARHGIRFRAQDHFQLDGVIEDELWEVKSPDGETLRSIEKAFRKAKKQSEKRSLSHVRVVLNLKYFGGDDTAVRNKVIQQMDRQRCNEAIIIYKDSSIEFMTKG